MADPATAWLESRLPPAPPALLHRLRAALAEPHEAADDAIAERCLEAGERVLAGLLCRDCAVRDAALDLLAADALITHAFEAASDEPSSLAPLAERAMSRLSALAESASATRTA